MPAERIDGVAIAKTVRMVRPGAVVIDVGVIRVDDLSSTARAAEQTLGR